MIEFIIFLLIKMRLLEEKIETLKLLFRLVKPLTVSNELKDLINNLNKLNTNNIHSRIILYTLEHLIECINNNTINYRITEDVNNQVKIALRRSGIF